MCTRVSGTECLVQCDVLPYSCEMPAYPVMIRECRVITGAASVSSQGHLWLPSLTKAKLPGLPSTFIRTPHQSPLSLSAVSQSASLSIFSALIFLMFLLFSLFISSSFTRSSLLACSLSYFTPFLISSIAGVFNVLSSRPPHKLPFSFHKGCQRIIYLYEDGKQLQLTKFT